MKTELECCQSRQVNVQTLCTNQSGEREAGFITGLSEITKYNQLCHNQCFSCMKINYMLLMQYAADAQDKHWLAEKQHMKATGGKMVRL